VYKQLQDTDTASEFIFTKDSFKSSLSIGPMNDIIYTPVTGKELKDIFKSLKNKNSSGYDGISMRLLNLSMPYVISPLVYICNSAMSTGIFTAQLKYSQIHPIYKKGEEAEISNYRPISVLTSFSQIFEKVIFNRLYAHVSE
jgi:Notch-like protein